jgi:hypothetical protein
VGNFSFIIWMEKYHPSTTLDVYIFCIQCYSEVIFTLLGLFQQRLHTCKQAKNLDTKIGKIQS